MGKSTINYQRVPMERWSYYASNTLEGLVISDLCNERRKIDKWKKDDESNERTLHKSGSQGAGRASLAWRKLDATGGYWCCCALTGESPSPVPNQNIIHNAATSRQQYHKSTYKCHSPLKMWHDRRLFEITKHHSSRSDVIQWHGTQILVSPSGISSHIVHHFANLFKYVHIYIYVCVYCVYAHVNTNVI
jgi:hypothetical protein